MNRVAFLTLATALAAAAPFDGPMIEIGPGEKKSPARGVRLTVDEPRPKQKSEKLKRLLRK